jgi:hypothetical protein
MSRERRQGLLPFEFTPDEDDAVTSWSGLTLLVDLMRQLGLPEHARSLGLRERASGHDEFQLLTAFVLLFAAGGDCMDDIRPLREDKALGRLLGQPYSPAPPDKQQVRLRVMDEHVDLTRWTRYSFASHFLTPTDGWSCTLGDGDLDERERRALVPGARVRLYVDQHPLAEGYIDTVTIEADRAGGVQYTIEGRDRLGLAVDSIADPTLQFKKGATLADVLKELFEPFGWVADEHFEIDNDANRDAKTGGIRGVPMTKGGKKSGPRPLKDFVLHQLKPHNHEGVFAFASPRHRQAWGRPGAPQRKSFTRLHDRAGRGSRAPCWKKSMPSSGANLCARKPHRGP